MEFANPTIAARYAMTGGDREIIIPNRYQGLLSLVVDPAILDGMIQRRSTLVELKEGGGTGVANTGGNYQFKGLEGQTVFPVPADPNAAAIRNTLKSTMMLIVAVEGSILRIGNAVDEYHHDTVTGVITFNQPISNQNLSIHYFK